MLLSLTLLFRAARGITTVPFAGRGVHAFFFRLLQGLGYEGIEALHKEQEKCFTVSPLFKCKESSNPCDFWFRITSLRKDLSRILLDLEGERVPPFVLRGIEFEPLEVIREQDKHPWAGTCSFEELYNNGLVWARAPKPDLLGFRFITPTAFRIVNSRLNMPLPYPRLVFQSLANKWNTFAPMPLWIDWSDFDRWITLARFSLNTKALAFGSFKQVGFVGECWFLVDPQAKSMLRQALYTLAQFAFYAGVGRKTTMGMGMVRPL